VDDQKRYDWTTVPCEDLNQDGCIRVGRGINGSRAIGTTGSDRFIECTPAELANFVTAAKNGHFDT
jgi:hypothetical protein